MASNYARFTFSTIVSLLALGLLFGASALAQNVGIESPADGEVVYSNYVPLLGYDDTAIDNTARWAVRQGTCAAGTGTVAGNVDGFSDPFDWSGGVFSALFDATGLPGGEYCFVLNTEQGPAAGHRQTQVFYLVDEYVKVGGTLYMGEDGRGNSPTHAMEGVVGSANGAVYGSITINYRELGEYRTFQAVGLSFRDAPGIGAFDPMAVGEITTAEGGTILVLDRDAHPDFPRGAIVVRPEGAPSATNPYEIDGSPGQTGADSWVPMDRGNNHTGER